MICPTAGMTLEYGWRIMSASEAPGPPMPLNFRKQQEKQVENFGFMLRRHTPTLSPYYSSIALSNIGTCMFPRDID